MVATMKSILAFLGLAASFFSLTSGVTISEINGKKYLSPYAGQTVTGVKGLVTAIGPSGFFIKSTTLDLDYRSSNSIYVFGRTAIGNITVGDLITLDATVEEYRSSAAYLYLTELITPKNIAVVSRGNKVIPIVIGQTLLKHPPTGQYSSLDGGDVFAVPNNQSRVSVTNPTLNPLLYGLDFWESLSGEIVTLKGLTALAKPNQFGDTWVLGNWRSTGGNQRGGLTITDRGKKYMAPFREIVFEQSYMNPAEFNANISADANPEAILLGSPLDGTKNPDTTKLGDSIADVTGVVTQSFGFYRVLPLTKYSVTASKTPLLPSVTTLESSGKCDKITFGDYNVENLSPTSTILPAIAGHIVNYLKAPTFMFVQEIQDNNGATNDAVVSANLTLTTLVNEIKAQSGIEYAFASIDPVRSADGGQPGGNIRTAYLYQPSVIRLRKPNPGSSTDANEVLPGPTLKYNPGRIDPANPAWTNSRKPLVAEWETLDGKNSFFTVNVHFGSKGGSSSIQGDARPPVNGGVADRQAQAQVTADFIAQILKQDPSAKVIASGDFNEFAFVSPLETFTSVSGLLDMNDVAKVKAEERYTYLFDMNCQEIDHMFVSKSIAAKGARFDHVHINTWVSYDDQISDHDPSVAQLNICQ